MRSSILQFAARYLLPLFLVLSLVILYRGHNQPGGGFIGGLVAAAAIILYTIAFGRKAARKLLRVPAHHFIVAGLLAALSSSLLPTLRGLPLMTGMWVHLNLPLAGEQHYGTPLLFDLGVYLVVFGVMTLIVFTLSEESK